MSKDASFREVQKYWHGTFKAYMTGFIISLTLTAAAYFLVMTRPLPGSSLLFAVVTLAIIQAIAQLLFFLHIGKESQPHWETLVFLFTLLVLTIIIVGSFWIMNDLNQRVMPTMNHLAK